MTLYVNIFSNVKLEEFKDKEETNCVEVVSQESLNLSCYRDPIESVIISSFTELQGYTPQVEEMSQVYLLLEALEEKITEAMWTEHFESLSPKIKTSSIVEPLIFRVRFKGTP